LVPDANTFGVEEVGGGAGLGADVEAGEAIHFGLAPAGDAGDVVEGEGATGAGAVVGVRLAAIVNVVFGDGAEYEGVDETLVAVFVECGVGEVVGAVYDGAVLALAGRTTAAGDVVIVGDDVTLVVCFGVMVVGDGATVGDDVTLAYFGALDAVGVGVTMGDVTVDDWVTLGAYFGALVADDGEV